jgi:5S rRNA maturation endonuclease (ribonuclease M5)
MSTASDNRVISIPGNHSVNDTVEKLKGILQAKRVTLFALVDHSGEAEKACLKMRTRNASSSAARKPELH